VFLDPDSFLYYRVYLNNPSFIKIEPVPEKMKDWTRDRDRNILYRIRKLLMAENFSWNFKEADLYKRRTFPKSFLQNECSSYPCYVFQSPLSKAFNSYTHIKAEVEISEFVPDYERHIEI